MGSLSTPGAILIGLTVAGAMTGTGLYLGLRARSGAAPVPGPFVTDPAGANAAPEGSPMAALATASTQPPRASNAPAVAASARTAITGGVDVQHAKLVKECWEPSVAKSPTPASVTIPFDVTYDAQGNLLVASVREDVKRARPDVTLCVQRLVEWSPIAPTGAPVRANVVLTLP